MKLDSWTIRDALPESKWITLPSPALLDRFNGTYGGYLRITRVKEE
jgi:hypothetical protein